MIKIINENTDPRINLAVEEYALNYLIPVAIISLVAERTRVVVGRNQKKCRRMPFYQRKGIHSASFIRRRSLSHLGNLNFTFIVDRKERCQQFRILYKTGDSGSRVWESRLSSQDAMTLPFRQNSPAMPSTGPKIACSTMAQLV